MSPSFTSTLWIRPGTRAEILASRLGGVARFPPIRRFSASGSRWATATVTSGMAVSSLAEVALLHAVVNTGRTSRTPIAHRSGRGLIKRRSHDLLERSKRTLHSKQAVKISLAGLVQSALGINERQQVAFAGAIAVFCHFLQLHRLRITFSLKCEACRDFA